MTRGYTKRERYTKRDQRRMDQLAEMKLVDVGQREWEEMRQLILKWCRVHLRMLKQEER
jgi:hypothetical protein